MVLGPTGLRQPEDFRAENKLEIYNLGVAPGGFNSERGAVVFGLRLAWAWGPVLPSCEDSELLSSTGRKGVGVG